MEVWLPPAAIITVIIAFNTIMIVMFNKNLFEKYICRVRTAIKRMNNERDRDLPAFKSPRGDQVSE